MSDLARVPIPSDPGDGEEPVPLTVLPRQPFAIVSSPKGLIGSISAVRDDSAAMRRCMEKRALTMLPNFKLSIMPPVVMVSRKHPFERAQGEFVRESHHPGVFCEFYSNRRGRFMRLNDAYQHVVYQLQRAYWVEIPPDLPPDMLDLDLGWFPE